MTINDDHRHLNKNCDPLAGPPDDCGPAYGFGLDARRRYPVSDFADVESEMSSDWAASRGASILTWEWARHAAREAWNYVSASSRLCA